jgi:hypothetical protein
MDHTMITKLSVNDQHLLQKVDSQHGAQWVWRPTALLAGYGVLGID